MGYTKTLEIPTLDLSIFTSGTQADKEAWCLDLLEVCKTFGFVKLKGHGFSDEPLSELFKWVSTSSNLVSK